MNWGGFREVPRTGVIYVMHRAREAGYDPTNQEWANLGQGAPEVTDIPGAPPRITHINIQPLEQEYSPVAGHKELRQAVADMYNRAFRREKKSQYTWENVAMAGGGRTSLTRLATSLGNVNMGHLIPDYTAYEELLTAFKSFIPIPVLLQEKDGFRLSPEELERSILGLGLGALLLSNPCNPTGQIVEKEELRSWVAIARRLSCSLILDEFYSHYIYTDEEATGRMVSAAEFVENVNEDPVILVDGVTKNWRYPGWRMSWTVGPKEIINRVASAGSFLDGGPNHPFQNVVKALLKPEIIEQETLAIQKHFLAKRNMMLQELEKLGLSVAFPPQGTFYVWTDLGKLPAPLNDGFSFFEACLKEKVITVPGVFFDVNPGQRRSHERHRFTSYVRLSFGPSEQTLKQGLASIRQVIEKVKG